MTKTKEEVLSVQVIGEDTDISELVKQNINILTTTWSEFKNIKEYKVNHSILILELSKNMKWDELDKSVISDWLTHTSPFLYIPNLSFVKNELSTWFLEYLTSFGAKVFKGSSGKKELINYIKMTAERHPSEVITKVKPTDEGLVVLFADGAKAVIPFKKVKKIAESQDILWNEISIQGDRSYINIGVKNSEPVPIPYDVLREFVHEEKEELKRKYKKELELTAKRFGKRLKKLREEKGLTQEQLAKKMKKSRWTIMRIEQGEYLPKVSDLQKIAKAMKMDFEDVLER